MGNSPADASADVASCGREVRIMDDASVSGRSGSWSAESGIALGASADGVDSRGRSGIGVVDIVMLELAELVLACEGVSRG